MRNVEERVKRKKARAIISQRLHHYFEQLVDIIDTTPEKFFQRFLHAELQAARPRRDNDVRK